MKTQFIVFLLITFTSSIFAQIDTIYTKKGDVYPCTIIELGDEKINTIDNSGSELKVYHFLIDKVYFDSYGEIYTAEKGYTTDVDELEPALEWRLEVIEEEDEKSKAAKLNNSIEESEPNIVLVNRNESDVKHEKNRTSKNDEPRFSFGVFYVPYGLERKVFYFDQYMANYSVIDGYSSQIESQFSYHLKDRLFVTCNVGFNSATIKNTVIEKRNYFDPPNENENGYETETSLKLLTIEFGFKYYFMNLFSNHVSAYVQLGAGKTLAWADYSNKNLFEEDPPYYSEENRGEYLEDSNSPFLFQAGFGVEYFFNKSLSLHSSIRIYYSTTSAKYETVYKDDFALRINSTEQKRTDIVTKVGLGLNFYF